MAARRRKPEPRDKKKPDDQTVERPEPRTCTCESGPLEIFTTIGSLRPVGGRRLRIRVTISSVVSCDEGTPGHCYYEYTASAEVQREGRRRINGKWRRVWQRYPQRKAFIQTFTVHDDVNKTESPDRIDQTVLTLGEWFPKAPQRESTKITLELAGSIRGGWRTTINRNVELCVPKLDNPACPE